MFFFTLDSGPGCCLTAKDLFVFGSLVFRFGAFQKKKLFTRKTLRWVHQCLSLVFLSCNSRSPISKLINADKEMSKGKVTGVSELIENKTWTISLEDVQRYMATRGSKILNPVGGIFLCQSRLLYNFN